MKLFYFFNFISTLLLLDFSLILRCFLDGSLFLMEPAGIACLAFGAFRESFVLLLFFILQFSNFSLHEMNLLIY